MFDQLLATLGTTLAVGLSQMDSPAVVEERHTAMVNMIESLERTPELSRQLPFKVVIKRVNMSRLALSPIYSMYRDNSVCEIQLNNNAHTHLNYQVLASQQTGQTAELNATSLAYTLGHEIGHCMYKHQILKNKPVNSIYQLQREYWLVADKQSHPLKLDSAHRQLHEEVYADEFGIALAAAWQKEDLALINNKVIEFRKAMTAFDNKRNTHFYIAPRREKTALK